MRKFAYKKKKGVETGYNLYGAETKIKNNSVKLMNPFVSKNNQR